MNNHQRKEKKIKRRHLRKRNFMDDNCWDMNENADFGALTELMKNMDKTAFLKDHPDCYLCEKPSKEIGYTFTPCGKPLTYTLCEFHANEDNIFSSERAVTFKLFGLDDLFEESL